MKVKCPTCGFEHEADASNELQPISVLGYIGYIVLFLIPFLGTAMVLFFSLGGAKNQNLKNFARAYLCVIAAAVVLWAFSLPYRSRTYHHGGGSGSGTHYYNGDKGNAD